MRALLAMAALAVLGAGCRIDMHDNPVNEPFEKSEFFADKRASRPRVEGTVARGHLHTGDARETGRSGAAFVDTLPLPLTYELLQHGRERFNIYCSPCHGQTGLGNGMIVQRGYRRPSSFHVDRLRREPVGYYFDVMTRGFGAMPDYAAQVPVNDRWAIAAYIKALQYSQNARLEDVPADRRGELDQSAGGAAAPGHGEGHAAPGVPTPGTAHAQPPAGEHE